MAKRLTGDLAKLSPRLRLFANGSEEVNIIRSERVAQIAVFDTRVLKQVPQQLGFDATPQDRKLVKAKRGKMREIPTNVYVDVFVTLTEDAAIPEVLCLDTRSKPVRRSNIVAGNVRLDRLQELIDNQGVIAVDEAERTRFSPPLDVDSAPGSAPATRPAGLGSAKGRGVLIGIIDVQGFDFAHPDFLDNAGGTRFVGIWDQGGDSRPAPAKFGYGAEISGAHMGAAITAASSGGLPATELEPQSQMSPGSHGTHVASIAAGNAGMCPGADIAAVLIALPEADLDRRKSFYDSTRIAHAVEYLLDLGQARNQAVSINISLGTNGHAHDASSDTSRWIDYALATAGRSVCVAAGNAGQEAPATPDDWGFVMGRIHSSGTLTTANPSTVIEWIVLGDGIADLSENELEIWYSPRDRFEIEIAPPGGAWIGPVAPGEFIENRELPDGTMLSAYNERYATPNGANTISVYLTPFYSDAGVAGVSAGTWRIRLTARDVRDGDWHAWVERDDPQWLGPLGDTQAWFFPSFFSAKSNIDKSSVSSLACGQRVVSVANLDKATNRVNRTSSQGPTRDGRFKPDVCAPGTNIVAANGFDPDSTWLGMSGTSMASPYVTGVIGLMLEKDPDLTAAQIGGILQRTSKPLSGQPSPWRDDEGFGAIDAAACLAEVAALQKRKDLTP